MQGEEAQFNRQQRLIVLYERRYAKPIMRELNRFIEEQAAKLPITRIISENDYAEHKKNMQDILEKLYRAVIRQFSLETDKMIGVKFFDDYEAKFSYWEYLFTQWISEFGGAKAKQTSETTRRDIQEALDAILLTETAVSSIKIAETVLKVRDFSQFRAQMIALTEVHGASMYASRETANKIGQDLGVQVMKRWAPVVDARTRPAHAAMIGSGFIKMDEKFMVGGEKMDRPSDPHASAGNVINCRCSMVYKREGAE